MLIPTNYIISFKEVNSQPVYFPLANVPIKNSRCLLYCQQSGKREKYQQVPLESGDLSMTVGILALICLNKNDAVMKKWMDS